jgi:hypothetical protein
MKYIFFALEFGSFINVCTRKRCTVCFLEQITTERTCRIVAGAEPFVETMGMKFFATCSTTQFWQLIIRTVQNIIANTTLFNAFKSLVNISFPQGKAVQNRSILQYDKMYISLKIQWM